MVATFGRSHAPILAVLGVLGLTLGGLLVGYEPIGSDPDCMYRPIKSELARALRSGGLPFWSDRMGVGMPLVAESHAAAFYPLNWLLYGALSTPVAYRLAMWLHFAATGLATYLYARTLGLEKWGGALAALAFAICGFQSSHAVHEPLYHAVPYLPLALTLAERYLADGRPAGLAALTLGLGAAFTLGHFQIQIWTAGLVLLTGLWRVFGRETSWRRAVGLAVAVVCAGAVAAPQLVLTEELVRFVEFNRSIRGLSLFSLPPAHWAQIAFPSLFLGFRGDANSLYWVSQATSAREACVYVGTVPLVFAGVGLFACKDRSLFLWCWLAALGLCLATMPRLWPDGYQIVLHIPGLSLFRCPGRYTLLTSMGLCLLAGRGFDRSVPGRQFWPGFALATTFAGAATAWVVVWSSRPEILAAMSDDVRMTRIAAGFATWLIALGVVAAWRVGRASPWVPLLVTACELAVLFYSGYSRWGWSVRFPDDSPVFRRLARESRVGLVAGWVEDLPVRIGLTTGDPYTGIYAPQPNYVLEAAALPDRSTFPFRLLMLRFGVTHGIFEADVQLVPGEEIFRGEDPALDLCLPRRTPSGRRVWRLERYAGVVPQVRAAVDVREVRDWATMVSATKDTLDPNVVWFLPTDRPETPPRPRARSARVVRWDGLSGEVEHDGTCDLVLRRAYYPGWTARLDGGRATRIVPADGGLQSIRLPGSGPTRVTVSYCPTLLWPAASVSLIAITASVTVLAVSVVRFAGCPRTG